MIRFAVIAALLTLLVACNNKPAPQPQTSSSGTQPTVSQPAPAAQVATSVEVEHKLQEIAGKDAKNCGAVTEIGGPDVKNASDCALEQAKAKKPFLVSYAMPGLTVGIAGTSAGKLFTVQSEMENGHETAAKSEPCPAELRMAQSGRLTCLTPGAMGMSPGMGSPHGASPHGGMGMPAPGTPNPHQQAGPKTSH